MEKRITTGAALIHLERERQIKKEGWTPEHDAQHTSFELINAACAYLVISREREFNHPEIPDQLDTHLAAVLWPWNEEYFKPQSSLRNLIRAGALIAAEIDRRIVLGEDE